MVTGTSASKALEEAMKDAEPWEAASHGFQKIVNIGGRAGERLKLARWVGQSDVTVHDASPFIDRNVTLKWNKRRVKRTMDA
jgi:hypothetical protein